MQLIEKRSRQCRNNSDESCLYLGPMLVVKHTQLRRWRFLILCNPAGAVHVVGRRSFSTFLPETAHCIRSGDIVIANGLRVLRPLVTSGSLYLVASSVVLRIQLSQLSFVLVLFSIPYFSSDVVVGLRSTLMRVVRALCVVGVFKFVRCYIVVVVGSVHVRSVSREKV